MLSRVADHLYWMSRYIERAEHTARLLDVSLQQLELAAASTTQRTQALCDSLKVVLDDEIVQHPYQLAITLTFDANLPESVMSAISVARENARQVREQMSSEMWEQINRLYLSVRNAGADESWYSEPHQLYKAVKEGVHLFQGITDATMSYNEGWQFIQVGRYLERASSTVALLDVHYHTMSYTAPREASLIYLDWVALLKSVTAFEAYCHVYSPDVQSSRVAEFLLLNAEFPRSVRFAIDAVQHALASIAHSTASIRSGPVERLAGRLRASLDYGSVDEIMPALHEYLDQVQRQCGQLHQAIHHTYMDYPADKLHI